MGITKIKNLIFYFSENVRKVLYPYEMCENILTMCEEDLKKNILPNFHDESYLNKWINDNQYNANIIYPPKKLLHPEFDDRYPFALINTFIKDRYVRK